MVVEVGLTLTAAPLVTGIFPGVIKPAPPAKTAVRLLLMPEVIEAGVAVKLVTMGLVPKLMSLQPVNTTAAVRPSSIQQIIRIVRRAGVIVIPILL